MISGIFYEGSGIGNQLHRYVFARIKAKQLQVRFGMHGDFKGQHFMDLDKGRQPQYNFVFNEERINNDQGVDIRPYDKRTETIEDRTVVDGEFQDEKYFIDYLDDLREWLEVEPLEMDKNTCVINFRGGEYKGVKDLFLPKTYWYQACMAMLLENEEMKFEVHTDDPETAREFFPNYPIISDAALNWRSIRYANYLILSNIVIKSSKHTTHG